jgi:Recombination endonuclease VII
MLQLKTCAKCNETKTLADFCKASGGNYYRSECRACEKLLSKIRKTIKESAPPVPENYRCPICNRGEEEVKGRGGMKSGTWCCDHDHVTNKFRGWLCHQCNRALGGMNDNIDRLNNSIKYLEGSRK